MSRLPFELLLALRYLRPKRTFVSVITLISVLGVSLGVAVLIIVISVMTGFDRQLRDKILGFNAHLEITTPGRTIADYNRVSKQVQANPEVRTVAPLVLGRVLVETESQNGQSKAEAPLLRGMDPRLETNLTVLPKSIREGDFDVSDRGLLVGNEFADMMNLHVGDKLVIYSPKDLKKWKENADKEHVKLPAPPHYEVRGIFNVGYYDYDFSVIVTSLQDAQELYDIDNTVHGLLVMLREPYEAPRIARELSIALGPEYEVSTWMAKNSNLLNALVVEKNVQFYLLFFIMIVAALCILSALITFVVQKTREIGMLKALGATNLQISGVFLGQSAIIGVLGVISGYGLGMLAITYRNEFLHFMNRMTGFELFPASIYGFGELPAIIDPRDIAVICGLSFVICIFGGVLPAIRAGRLKPVEALRYE